MACFGGGPSQWEIDLNSQKAVTNYTIELRKWFVAHADIDDSFVEDIPGFDSELTKRMKTSESTGKYNPSSYNPRAVEAFITQNEQAKLCQVIRHIGENGFYDIVDAVGIKSKEARDIVSFWIEHKRIDDVRRQDDAKAKEKEDDKAREVIVDALLSAIGDASTESLQAFADKFINNKK